MDLAPRSHVESSWRTWLDILQVAMSFIQLDHQWQWPSVFDVEPWFKEASFGRTSNMHLKKTDVKFHALLFIHCGLVGFLWALSLPCSFVCGWTSRVWFRLIASLQIVPPQLLSRLRLEMLTFALHPKQNSQRPITRTSTAEFLFCSSRWNGPAASFS